MAIQKIISKGIGVLTPKVWERIANNVEWGERVAASNPSLLNNDPIKNPIVIEAAITSVESVANKAIWRYGFEQVLPRNDIDTTYSVLQYGINAAGTLASGRFALNRWECANTDILAYGYNVTGGVNLTDFTGFAIASVPLGTIVMMSYQAINGESYTDSPPEGWDHPSRIWVFEAPNPIIGACP